MRFETNFTYEYTEDLVETYGYALINQGDYATAMDILHYESHYSSTDFIFLKALILMNNGQLQNAVDLFTHCTKMPPGNKEGVNTYKANYNIGVILECVGMKQKALEFYQNVVITRWRATASTSGSLSRSDTPPLTYFSRGGV